METISAIQKRLRKLPKKDDGKTRAEALEMLTADLQKALAKGYSLQELREIVREEGATLALAGLEGKSGKESASEGGEDEDRDSQIPLRESSKPTQKTAMMMDKEPSRSSEETIELSIGKLGPASTVSTGKNVE
jgi:hypothetical protein